MFPLHFHLYFGLSQCFPFLPAEMQLVNVQIADQKCAKFVA
uniref:Uncharacterized protein n=1 Tax=viral metagenome TaxID=1070528 RepID=A0A6C0KU66_9ZZZZ